MVGRQVAAGPSEDFNRVLQPVENTIIMCDRLGSQSVGGQTHSDRPQSRDPDDHRGLRLLPEMPPRKLFRLRSGAKRGLKALGLEPRT